MTRAKRVEGLRNLRDGYNGRSDAAVGFWKSIHGEDIIEEYATLAAELERAHAVIEAARLHHAACLAEPMDGAAVSYVCVSLWAAIAAFDRQATETTT